MSERILPHRTQALFLGSFGPREKEELLLRCYQAKIEPEKAAVLLEMRTAEVENWYLRVALSMARLELRRCRG